jgi:hypothetical protein
MADLRARTSGFASKFMGSGRGAEMAVWSGWECVKVGLPCAKPGGCSCLVLLVGRA